MRKLFLFGFVVLGCALLLACQPNLTPIRTVEVERIVEVEATLSPQEIMIDNASVSVDAPAGVSNRLIVKNAELSIIVDDPAETTAAMSAYAAEKGGYVVTSSIKTRMSQLGIPQRYAIITFRVPADVLDDALVFIRAQVDDQVKDIISEEVTGKDVTEEYTDLSSRLKNSELAEIELGKLLANAEATNDTTKVLNVFKELKKVREEIELIKGRMIYLEESAAMSSIKVTIAETIVAVEKPIETDDWQFKGVVKESIQALLDVLAWIVAALTRFTIVCMPFIVVLGLPVFFLIRKMVRKRKAAKREQL